MQIKDKDINYIPNIGIGRILFNNNEVEVIKVLGDPVNKEYDEDSEVVRYEYKDKWINFHYEDGQYDYMSIHTKIIVINKCHLEKLKPKELLIFLKDFYRTINLLLKYEYEETELDEFYYFNDIGLTIWFEKNIISDICIQKKLE